MQLINATPHRITILAKYGVETDPKTKQFIIDSAKAIVLQNIEPSKIVARVSMANQPAGEINGIPLETVTFGDIVGLPDEQPDVFYIVSLPVLTAVKAKGRTDCLGIGGAVRDKANASTIVGCLFLQK